MQTIKMLSKILDGTTPNNEKYHASLFEADHIEYRWYYMKKKELDEFIKIGNEIQVMTDLDSYFKRRSDSGMSDDITFCYLYFYDRDREKYTQLILIDVTVFIMNSAGQTIDKIYS